MLTESKRAIFEDGARSLSASAPWHGLTNTMRCRAVDMPRGFAHACGFFRRSNGNCCQTFVQSRCSYFQRRIKASRRIKADTGIGESSLDSKSVLGSRGYQPVTPGNLSDGTGGTTRAPIEDHGRFNGSRAFGIESSTRRYSTATIRADCFLPASSSCRRSPCFFSRSCAPNGDCGVMTRTSRVSCTTSVPPARGPMK